MSLETTFAELCGCLRQLRDALAGLRLTVAEDKPLREDVALVDHRTDTIEDVLGHAEEALEAASRGQRAAQPPTKVDVAREGLSRCHVAFSAAAHKFRADLVSYERVAELVGLGRHRGGEWQAWAVTVREALRRCEQPLYDVNQSLINCWQEVVERAAGTSVSVRTTTIGQKILIPFQAETENA